jgi:quinoprotein glucose dehydrogenase
VVVNNSSRAAYRHKVFGSAMRVSLPVVLALGAAACTTAAPQNGAASASAAGAESLPREAFDYVGWDAYLGGSESSQYSALDQINTNNVNQLQVAWTYPTGEGQPPQFNPIVANGMMYVTTGDGKIAALEPATGRELWKSETTGRISARGINYWQSADGNDRRLVFLNDGLVRAVDARTGKYIPNFSIDVRDALPEGHAETPRPLMTNNPGRIFEDTYIVSLPAGAYDYASSPADIQAYDIRTGAVKWVFHVVPRIGEFGSDTWPEKDREKFGGVHNWSESTLDPELGIIYIPTGTARYDFYGGNRPGDNLFANSIVALDARTGKRIWHFQTVHHDLWDFDLPNAPKLMTITKDGRKIPIIIVASKQGFLFVFDRRTGEPVWPIEERPVPASDVPGEQASPTQPFPTWPQPFSRQTFTEADINPYLPEADQEALRKLLRESRNEGIYTPPSLRGSISMPGHNGGTNWGNTAGDPTNQRFFVVSREIPLLIKLNPDNRPAELEKMPNGSPGLNPYKSPVNFLLQSNGMVAIKPPFSYLTAYDMNTGNIMWRVPNGEVTTLEEQGIEGVGSQAPRGGPVATAGGLLFVGTATDRTFRARDAATGNVLWEHKLDAATEGVPAVYEVGGRQYVTIPVGGVGHFAGGLGLSEPGPSKYVTFALPAGAR